MLKNIWKSVWPPNKRKKLSLFDFEITQTDLVQFPSEKFQIHWAWNRQVWYDSTMWLNYLHNTWSDKWLLKLLVWTLTDASKCIIQFYFANAVSSGWAWVLRSNFHTPMMNKTDWKFRGYWRNDIRYYNYVDQSDSASVLFSGFTINTLYEMEVWKQWSWVHMHIREIDWEWSWSFIRNTAGGSSPSQYYCLHSGKGWWSIADFRYTHVGVTLNA
jgi:hypothetical protein